MNPARILTRVPALALAALVLASCAESPTTHSAASAPALRGASTGPTLLECPVETTRSTRALVTPLGGVVELDGHRLVIPPQAVLVPTEFTLTVPASQYVKVDVRAGSGEHYQFQRPVSLTLSYARCTRTNIDKEALKIFYVDSATDAILEDMGGTDDKAGRTVTTGTDHLSGYVIGQG